MTILELTGKPGACSQDRATNDAIHREVRADAATGAPVTSRGRALLESSRMWPEAGLRIGECECGGSLCFRLAGDPPAVEDDDQEVHAA